MLEAYLGHTSGDVLGEHYQQIDSAELRMVSSPMDRWRDAVGKDKTGNILASGKP